MKLRAKLRFISIDLRRLKTPGFSPFFCLSRSIRGEDFEGVRGNVVKSAK